MVWTFLGASLLSKVALAVVQFLLPGDGLSADEATLRVVVRSSDTGGPVAGARVQLRLADTDSSSTLDVEGSVGRLGQSPTTDAGGRARFVAPTGRALLVVVLPGETGGGSVRVEPIQASRKREVVIEVATRPDVLLVGRVLSDETGRPLADARVALVGRLQDRHFDAHGNELDDGGVSALHVDAAGRFEVPIGSWSRPRLEVRAPGHGTRLVSLERGREADAEPLEVRLPGAAVVEVTVTGADGAAIEGARVEVSAGLPSLHEGASMPFDVMLGSLAWVGRTGPDGRSVLVDVPAGISCSLKVAAPGPTKSRSSRSLTLDPGERRALDVRVGLLATLSGTLVDASGASTADVELWLLPARHPFLLLFDPEQRTEARVVRTDSAGRFQVEGVAPGLWWLGPALGGKYTPLPESVLVEEGTPEVELRLELTPGLTVAGVVLGPDGGPVARAQVDANASWGYLSAQADEAGRFVLGPVPEGALKLEARGPGFSRSSRVEVPAGERGVVLRLGTGGDLRGVFRDGATGQPVRGEVTIAPSGGLDPMKTRTQADGVFSFEGLDAGSYDLWGWTLDHKVAVRSGVTVSGSEPPAELTLSAEPGASLVLRYQGSHERVRCRLLADGSLVGALRLARGSHESATVPAGAIRVELLGAEGSALDAHEFELVVGESRWLELGEAE